MPVPQRPGPSLPVPKHVPPPSSTRMEENSPVVGPPPPTPPTPTAVFHACDGPLVPDLNVLVEESTSFPTPTVRPIEAPVADTPAANLQEKESSIPGTFEPDEEPSFQILDLERGLVDFERDFGQWFTPSATVVLQPTVEGSSSPTNPEPVVESQATHSPAMSERAAHPVSSSTPEPPLRATFISDNNISDGHLLPPGAEFVKSWKVLNDGVRDWPEATQLIFVAGDKLVSDSNTVVKVGKVVAGEEMDIWTGDMKVCLPLIHSVHALLTLSRPPRFLESMSVIGDSTMELVITSGILCGLSASYFFFTSRLFS